MNQVTVIVPATTANLGVGFDCLGAALSLYNEFKFTLLSDTDNLKISVIGTEAEKVSVDESNLLYRSFAKFYEQIERTPPKVAIEIKLGVPLARGLGSSATAIVGGLVAANYLAGNILSQSEVMEKAIAIEGHPDNVVPALLGSCRLSVGETGNWQISEIPWHQEIIPVVAIPNFELSTEAARAVLPQDISRSDAIFNISRMGLLLRGLETNNGDWLKIALEDKLHQPYRQTLIPGYQEIKTAAIASGAYGMVISGAGPTLLALTNPSCSEKVALSMQETWAKLGVKAQIPSVSVDKQGTRIIN
jgi:homoserine kinase